MSLLPCLRAPRPRCPDSGSGSPALWFPPRPEGTPRATSTISRRHSEALLSFHLVVFSETPTLPGTRAGASHPASSRLPGLAAGALRRPLRRTQPQSPRPQRPAGQPWAAAPGSPSAPSAALCHQRAGGMRQATLSTQDGEAPVPRGMSVGPFIQWDPNFSWGQKTWVCQ